MHSSTNYSVVEYLKQRTCPHVLLKGKAVVREAHPITLYNSEPEPDIAIVATPHTNYFTRHPCPQDIYWLVEISNRTLKSDLEKKSITYACNGIPEYWIIDLVNKQIIVHAKPINNSYSQVRHVAFGTITTHAFPELAIAKLAEGIALDKLLLF